MRKEKTYLIRYEVDTGHDYVSDSAIVFDYSPDDAVTQLKEYIKSLDNGHTIHEIFSVELFFGTVFSSRYNKRDKKEN